MSLLNWFRKPQMDIPSNSQPTSFILADEERKIAESLGFTHVNQLPEFIDFERTAKEFMLQARKLDFSNPVLYPKELLK